MKECPLLSIAIVGAGIGGLTAGLALLRKGFTVRILEQAGVLGEIGAGVQISANGTKALSRLGLGERIEAVATEAAGKQVRLWNTGATWKLFDLGAASREIYGSPYLMMHRADLHGVLTQAVRELDPEAIVLGQKVTDITQDASSVTLTTAGGRTFTADVAIGADGVHSQVRHSLFDALEPEFPGIIAWRGVIRASDLPAHLRAPYGVNWVGKGGHVVHYPLRRNELVNIVGVVEKTGWQVESWSTQGRVEDFAADFDGWHEDVQTLIRSVATPYKWALMVRPPMTHWTRGRVALLGDACHPTLPFLAQGAVMAIEDGYILARALAEYADDPVVAVQRYEAARVERTTRVVEGSAGNARRFHNPVLASHEGASEYVDREWAEDRVKERYDWLFRYDVDQVPL